MKNYPACFCLFDLNLYVPVNNLSVISGRVFLCLISIKQGLMCPAQGHNAVTPVRLEPAAPLSRVKHSTTEPLCSPYPASKELNALCAIIKGITLSIGQTVKGRIFHVQPALTEKLVRASFETCKRILFMCASLKCTCRL